MADLTNGSLQALLKADAKAFNGIFVVSFIVLLSIALVAQALTLQWRNWLPGAEGEKSLVGAVRAAVYSYMSYLN